jgi:hypothetical protein
MTFADCNSIYELEFEEMRSSIDRGANIYLSAEYAEKSACAGIVI